MAMVIVGLALILYYNKITEGGFWKGVVPPPQCKI